MMCSTTPFFTTKEEGPQNKGFPSSGSRSTSDRIQESSRHCWALLGYMPNKAKQITRSFRGRVFALCSPPPRSSHPIGPFGMRTSCQYYHQGNGVQLPLPGACRQRITRPHLVSTRSLAHIHGRSYFHSAVRRSHSTIHGGQLSPPLPNKIQ